MKEYHKIETLFKFNQETKRWVDEFYNKNVEILKDNIWLFTEKIDGTNFRIFWDGHKLVYGGRTDNAVFSKREIEYIEKELVNEEKTILFEQKFNENQVIVYGELFGAGIQNGGLYVKNGGYDFKVFDIEIGEVFLEYSNACGLTEELGYNFVPICMAGTIERAIEYVMKFEKSIFSEAKLEGLVGKPIGDFRDRLGKRIVVKIKKKDLLKTDFTKGV